MTSTIRAVLIHFAEGGVWWGAVYFVAVVVFFSMHLLSSPETQSLYGHPITRAEILGFVVAVQRRQSFISFTGTFCVSSFCSSQPQPVTYKVVSSVSVDDGTGLLVCNQWVQMLGSSPVLRFGTVSV